MIFFLLSIRCLAIGGSEACGPKIILRSIKGIQRSEEVLITYTDLLQPKVQLFSIF